MIVGNRFKLNNKINSGSFGQIHLATDIKTKQTIAIKLQSLNNKHPQLQYQAKLLAYLNDQINPREYGIPRLHYYGKTEQYHVMAMDLLGPSLEELFQKCGKKFDLKTVVMIGSQIIDRLRFLHKKKFIHRDIKPENFLLGLNQYCTKVFMIDLGLSKKYVQKNGQHISYRDDRSLKGTPRYTSLNSHLGIQQSRRDDLQSVVYMLIYFMKGQLPWQNLKPDANYDRYEKILEKKLSVTVQNLTLGLPSEFKQLVNYTRNLHFIEEPNYEFMKKLLEQALQKNGHQIYPNDFYCWQKEAEENVEEPLEQYNVREINKNQQTKKKENQINYSPFDSNDNHKKNENIKKQIIMRQKPPQNDSFDLNPFELKNSNGPFNFSGHNNDRKDSLDRSDDNPFGDPFIRTKTQNDDNPFGTKTQQSQQDDNPFGQFDRRNSINRKNKDQSYDNDDPFGDFGQPDIVQL